MDIEKKLRSIEAKIAQNTTQLELLVQLSIRSISAQAEYLGFTPPKQLSKEEVAAMRQAQYDKRQKGGR